MIHKRVIFGLILSLVVLVPPAINQAQHRVERVDNPAAFGAWYDAAFKHEQAEAYQRNAWDDRGFYFLEDYHGQYFNFDHGVRKTIGQPAADRPVLYLSGDSVTYGYTVPDNGTIASALQELSASYKIVNLGTPGTSTTTALRRLKTLALRAGDIVVWISGINESRQIYYTAQKQKIAPSGSWLQSQLDVMRSAMQRDIFAADAYVQAHGARFVWILQPYMWSSTLTSGEAQIYIDDDLRNVDNAARPVQQALLLPGIESHDFTHVVDGLRLAGKEIYMDHIHLNPLGNSAVARAIYNAIWPTF